MYAPLRALAFLLAATPAFAAPPVVGEYESPLGRVRVDGDGTTFKGTLVRPTEGLPYREGDEVLRATLLDDSLAGQVRLPLVKARSCKQREVWASGVLLVGETGLAGAVHLPKGCQGPVGKKGGVTFRRSGGVAVADASGAAADPAPTAAKPRPPPASASARKAARQRAHAELEEGAAFLTEGNFEQARKRFLAALDEDPTVPEAYNGVGVTYRMRNDLPKALAWYKKALTVNPDFGDAYYNMACIYAMQGEKELALRYLQVAALNGYTTSDTIDHDPDLESLRGEKAYQALLKQN